jgi:thymidylate synthase (FAD)
MEKTLVKESMFYSAKRKQFTIQFWAGEVAEVALVDYPSSALATLARATRGYLGNYTMDPFKEGELELFAAEIQKTPLGTPVEMLNFVFLVRDVPRSFTHQLVRTRIGASYVQQSTRFLGALGLYKVLVPGTCLKEGKVDPDYYHGTCAAIQAYADTVEKEGVKSEDARQLLPHAILTHVFWSINMKALKLVYNQRKCCCAEPSSWLPLVSQVKRLITEKCGPVIGGMLTSPVERGESCGFNSKLLDQPCRWSNGRIPK